MVVSRRPYVDFAKWKRQRTVYTVILMTLLALIGGLSGVAFTPIDVDVSSLALLYVNGQASMLNTQAHSPQWASPEALTDSLCAPNHGFDFPEGTDGELLVRLPPRLPPCVMTVVGSPSQPRCRLVVSYLFGLPGKETAEQLFGEKVWRSVSGVPPAEAFSVPEGCEAVRLRFVGASVTALTALVCNVNWPRWQAWLYFGLLVVIGPWLLGLALIWAVLGWGRWIGWSLGVREGGPCESLVGGLPVLLIVSALWVALPRCLGVNVAYAALVLGSALAEWHWQRRAAACDDPRATEYRLVAWLPVLALFLLLSVTVDSYGVGLDRVEPADHLHAFFGAQFLSRDLDLPSWMVARPWLAHVCYAPLDRLAGRFSYWAYLGFLASLNALVVLPVGALLGRWQPRRAHLAVGLLLLMPILGCYHFLGQRLLAAGLALLAGHWLTSVPAQRHWFWPALALTLAVGVHPSALFVLPSLLVCAAWRIWRGGGWSPPLSVVATVSIVYSGWTILMHWWFPGCRNDLFYYPLMLDYHEPFPSDQSIWDIVRSIPAADWLQLSYHRLLHLRHYLWTDNCSVRASATFRWISLPNVFGYLATVLLLWPSWWRRDRRFVLLMVAGPLLTHHLWIGASHAQLHISPTPLLAVAALLAAELSEWRRHWLLRLVLLEWLFRTLWPLLCLLAAHARVEALPMQHEATYARVLCFFSNDEISYVLLTVTLPVCWLFMLCRALRDTTGADGPFDRRSGTQ